MNEGPVGVAVVGAGNISTQYLENLTRFPDLRVLGVGDLDTGRAAEAAARYGVPASGTLDEVLALPGVELVVNLTIPAAHAEVAAAALKAGKHVYGEKPLSLDPASARVVLAEAASRGLSVGNAPDTFLGAGIQSAARAIAAGAIGRPVAASAAFQSAGPERWHPSPEFLFAHGAGPLFDMGPYYLTALISLLGPVAKVGATGRKAHEERVIGSGPKAGQAFPVEVPTHVTALLEFASGSVGASATFSFDSPVSRATIEIVGTEATLWVPDPNRFGGPLQIRAAGEDDWRELPVEGTEAGRGIGVVEMARALRAGVPHRASGDLALHVLDVMTAILASAERGEFASVGAGPDAAGPVEHVEPIEPLPVSWDPFAATL